MFSKDNETQKKNLAKESGAGQLIQCGVTDCTHNCIDNSTCRLENIKVNVMSDRNRASCKDGTACYSYNFAGDLNETEITGRD